MKITMKIGIITACSALMMAGVMGTIGCAKDTQQRTAGNVMDDSALTARIKADLFADPLVKGHQVNVESYQGNVQLNGFVETPEQKQRAEEIARGFPEVASVQNNLAIRLEGAGAAIPNK